MRKDKLSSFQAKKQKLLKIKEILNEQIPEKTAWKMTPMDLVSHYQVQQTKIWEIVKDE